MYNKRIENIRPVSERQIGSFRIIWQGDSLSIELVTRRYHILIVSVLIVLMILMRNWIRTKLDLVVEFDFSSLFPPIMLIGAGCVFNPCRYSVSATGFFTSTWIRKSKAAQVTNISVFDRKFDWYLRFELGNGSPILIKAYNKREAIELANLCRQHIGLEPIEDLQAATA